MNHTAIHPAKVTKVMANSIGEELGFQPGDAIISINGTRPQDLIDYQFLCADEWLELEVIDAGGTIHQIAIEKELDDNLGLEFENALFDGLMQCNNHCPFCFIDQQPPGKRKTLYLKDDDYRLSFLYGSYLTLTNLRRQDWQRIEKMRLSPLYVSIHATEPEIRIKLLKNSRAGQILEQLQWFSERRLQVHAQVVVCPGLNDQQHLETTIRELAQFHQGEIPAVISVAVVPVGLTRFRPSHDELVPVSPQKAREVIEQIQRLQDQYQQTLGTHFVWLADEWFLIAGIDLPAESHYENYPQIGNGVGSIRQFLNQFRAIAQDKLPGQITPAKQLTWVVGNAVESAFQPLVEQLNQVEGLAVRLAALSSDYWGQEITVTGLLTGEDLISKLKGKSLGDGILLPSLMLKHDDNCFLDDMTVETVSEILNTPIYSVTGIENLIATCLTV